MPASVSPFGKPLLLTEEHDLASFDSGEAVLDDWLRRLALSNIETAASRTYVVCSHESAQVIGFYAVSMGQILAQDMPRQIPSVILGRLAIDRNWQGRGLGRLLLGDATQRSVLAAKEVSARLMIVHAISPAAEAFYLHHGFARLPVETPTLAIDLIKLQKIT